MGTGDKQELTWTYDGQVERITGQGSGGRTDYIGPADKCLDLQSGVAAAGQLTHPASGLCVAVKDGATVNSTPIVLAACAGGSAAQQWEAQNETRHIYGPDGSRLLTVQGKQATLHLGDSEVTVQKGGVLVNTQRSHATPDGSVLRYSYGTGAQQLVAIATDHQGSPYAEVALNEMSPVRIRKQDPFGNQRGAATPTMQNHAGFLGATRDDSSGYTPLGARLYDPVVGRFLSADPVLDLADQLQSNGYAYAHNNPVTLSDPTGLSVTLTASETAAALSGAGLSAAQVSQAQAAMGRSLTSVILSAAWGALKDFIGITDAMNCFGGDMWACGSLIIGAIPWTKLGKIPSVLKAVNRTISAIQAWRTAKKAAQIVLAAAKAAEKRALDAKKAAIEKAKKAAQAAKKKAAEKANTTSNKAVNQTKKTGNPVQKQAQAKAAPKVSSAASVKKASGGGGKGVSKPGGSSGGSARSKGGTSGSGGSGKTGEGASCSIGNSFTPGTKVLMADGSAKPIEDVKAGDKVKATDPRTGETRVETVTAEIKGEGLKRLVKVVIDTDGERGSKTAEVTATDGHPFWVPELDKWIDATDLQPGQWLHTGSGTQVQITAVERWTSSGATVHNLTVGNTHTYYVAVGTAPVLVHNCGNRGGADVDHLTDMVDGMTDIAGAGAGWRTMGALHADTPTGGLDLAGVGARADLTQKQWESLPDLGRRTLAIRVPQPAKTVDSGNLWHAEVKLWTEAAGILQIQPRLLVVSRPISPACSNFLTRRGATITSATTAEW
ncbi:RHS repeat-associated core domain-containing protein [Streptomyces microflavus]|uniref:RHS repeat-associated core domain-containing protein n=1 Tax=Streptomyces microflavus TaxID=1919 RepID=UPI0033CC162D